MPPCPWYRTAGTFSTGVFAPCWVTSQAGPTFSVMSMRPAGRNAMRQGSLNVATSVIVNGRLGSGFCSPALICASAVADTSVTSSAAFRIVFMYVYLLTLAKFRDHPRVTPALQNEVPTSEDDSGRTQNAKRS